MTENVKCVLGIGRQRKQNQRSVIISITEKRKVSYEYDIQ